MFPVRTILITFFVLAAGATAFADTLQLKSGRTVEGDIVKQTSQYVGIKTGLKKPIEYYLVEDIETLNSLPLETAQTAGNKTLLKKFFLRAEPPAPAGLEVIELRNGRTITGEIVKRTKYYVEIKPSETGIPQQVLNSEIVRITKAETAASQDSRTARRETSPQTKFLTPRNPEDVKQARKELEQIAEKKDINIPAREKMIDGLTSREQVALANNYTLSAPSESIASDETAPPPPSRVDQLTGRKSGRTELEMGTEISSMVYEEKGVMTNKGAMYGLYGVFTYRPWADYSPDPVMNEMNNAAFIRIDGKWNSGHVDYDSQGTGTDDDIKDYMMEFRGTVGYDIAVWPSALFSPYMGYGYRYLNDDSKGRTTSTGHLGYDREANYYYIPVGFNIAKSKKSWVVNLNVEYDYFLDGSQNSHLEDLGPSVLAGGRLYTLDNLVNDQDSGFGARGSLKIMKMGKHVDLFIEPFVRFWKIRQSDPTQWTSENGHVFFFYLGTDIPVEGIEPKNTTTEFGLKAGARF